MDGASNHERMKMKITSKDFRVREDEKVTLKKWPTLVKPVYKSKKQYQKLWEEHIDRTNEKETP